MGEVGLYRTRASHCTHIKQHVLMMSQKETGSVPLSYRCSHEHQTVTQLSWRISSSLSLALFLCSPRQSDKSVSDLMAGSETLVSASTSSSSGPLAVLHCRGNQHSNDALYDIVTEVSVGSCRTRAALDFFHASIRFTLQPNPICCSNLSLRL